MRPKGIIQGLGLMSALAGSTLVTASAASAPAMPDLCAEPVKAKGGKVYADLHGQTISRYCDPKVDPPDLDRHVCCTIGADATCTLPDAQGNCKTGKLFWCEHGKISGQSVECYQSGPGTCEKGYCKDVKPTAKTFDESSWVCCTEDGTECTYVGEGGDAPPPASSCNGELTICNWGSLNDDNTVNCDI